MPTDGHALADTARLCIIHDDAPGSAGYGVQMLIGDADDARVIATGTGSTLPVALCNLAESLREYTEVCW